MNGLHQLQATGPPFPGPSALTAPSLVERVAKAVTDFNNQLSSAHTGALSQVWLPEVGEDGSIVLNTQGLPYAINGAGDLLALFRCISCKYKFSTDLTKPLLMGAVGRVFTSGEPEMSHNVQQYDKCVFLRAAEAQRCRISSVMFMPLFNSPKRDCVLGVFEVVQTDRDVLFTAVVDWLRCCLKEMDLFTADVDKHAYAMGLRQMPPEYNVSAFESGTAAVLQHQRHLAVTATVGGGSLAWQEVRGSMDPPPWQSVLDTQHAQQQQAEVQQRQLDSKPTSVEKPLHPARPSRSDPTSNRTGTASAGLPSPAGRHAFLAGGNQVQASGLHQDQVPLETVDAQGDTLMGSTGQADDACEGAVGTAWVQAPSGMPRTRLGAPTPQQEQEQHMEQEQHAKQEDPQQQQQQQQQQAQEGGLLEAGLDDDGEDEVTQPAKPPRSGAHLESSGATISREVGQGSGGIGFPSTENAQHGGALEGSGRGSNPSNEPTASPPPQVLGQTGSLTPPLTAARRSDGSGPNPIPPTSGNAAAAVPGPAPDGAGMPAAGNASGRLGRAGTSAQLYELERLHQPQMVAGRPGSAPPVGTPGSWHTGRNSGLKPRGSGDKSAEAFASPDALQQVPRPQIGSAEATTFHQPLAATLAGILAPHSQQRAQQGTAAPSSADLLALLLPPPSLHKQVQRPLSRHLSSPQQQFPGGTATLLCSTDASGTQHASLLAPAPGTLRSPAMATSAAGLPSMMPGGTMTVIPRQGSMPSSALGADAGRAGQGGDFAQMGSIPGGGDHARFNSGGVGQKNLTLEDLQPHFGYGLKEAASRLGICPTTLKRTCRRLGISRWPRRQLVRLTKQAAAAVNISLDEPHRPLSASDGSGSAELAPQQAGVQLPFRAPGQGLIASPAAPGHLSLAGSPALLLALQQAQQLGDGARDAREEGPQGISSSVVASPSLHQRLLQLQQHASTQQGQQAQQLQQQGVPLGGGLPRGVGGLQIDPEKLASLQQQLLASAGTAPGAGSGSLQQLGETPGLGSGSLPPLPLPGPKRVGLVNGQPPFVRGGSMGPGAFSEGPVHDLFRPRSLPRLPQDRDRHASASPQDMHWEQQQPRQALMGGINQDVGEGAFSLFGPPGGSHNTVVPDGSGVLGQRQLPEQAVPTVLAGPSWQLPPRTNGSSGANTAVAGDTARYAELAAAAAAANMHHHLGGSGGFGGQLRRPPDPPNGLSLTSLPHFGGIGGHSVESLDILAAADFDSVANSPRGVSYLGGLSNLGLSNLGVSNLEMPGGTNGLDFSVGAPFPAGTSSQRLLR